MPRKTVNVSAFVTGLVLVAFAIAGSSPSSAAAAPVVGSPAPIFTGTDSNGQTHSLDGYRGKVVVLEWTNHECPFVSKHYGTDNMQNLQRWAIEQDVVWLSIVSSAPGTQGYVTAKQANAVLTDHNAAPTATLLDPEGTIGRLYGARVTPHMYIVGSDGTLLYMGGIDDKPTARWRDVETANNYVRAALDDILAGGAVRSPVTRAYGCTVKYKG